MAADASKTPKPAKPRAKNPFVETISVRNYEPDPQLIAAALGSRVLVPSVWPAHDKDVYGKQQQ